jgi:diketogulonate reductase-like aldo/keto reductase
VSILAAQAIILDPNATSAERIAALDEVPNQGPGFYLLRSVLLLDRDALLRACAAERLAIGRAEMLLVEAAGDPQPRVREAAIASLAKIQGGASIVRRALLEDPIWWVRRAAAHALPAICGSEAAEALIGALDDPFWRVRHAAVSSLAPLAFGDPQLQLELTALRGRTASAEAALERLRRVLGGAPGPAPDRPAPRPNGVLFNEDPAVMTARLEDPAFRAPISELIELLPNSHAVLRKLVIARLAQSDERVLRAATVWLEDPRIPHAVEAVLEVLSKAAGARAVAEAILADAESGERARAWAIAWIGAVGLTELAGAVRAATSHPSPLIRAVACESCAKLGCAPPSALLDDGDERVALAAVQAYAEVDPHALSARPYAGSTAVRRALFEAADRIQDRDRFAEAARDPDPYLRASGLGTLARAGLLASRDFDDPDPWIRLAVLSPEHLDAALDDPDLEVRRAAMDRLRPRSVEAERAAMRMMEAPDPILRLRAAELTGDRDLLLALSMDRSPAVRSAAAEKLEGVDVREVLAAATDPIVRRAAFTRLFGTEEIERALPHESPEVRAHLESMLIPFRESAALPPDAPRWQEPVSQVEQRPLGRTGMLVSPLAISGAFDLSPGSLLHAFERGVNLFFWEPRYTAMTRFLRTDPIRRDRLHVVAGSFSGSPQAVEADVDRALSRLRTERMDVFLLFWVRSPERLSDELHAALQRMKEKGKIGAFGFSTHDRKLACDAIAARPWDVIMVRHNAAHTGAEESVFPEAQRTGTGVLGFSALCYGRLLLGEGAPSPADCYRYSLHAGATSVISAPRRHRELVENLGVLAAPTLDPARVAALRAHGRQVYAADKDWAELIRRVPDVYENLQRSLLDAPESPSIARDSELR